MSQEDKELLLKDLCARVPYRVKIEGYELPCVILNSDWLHFMYTHQEFALRRPYLRPMSSMTEEENEEYIKRNLYGFHWDFVDWCNSKHLDYRGLIKKGLALEAPEGMYNSHEWILQ